MVSKQQVLILFFAAKYETTKQISKASFLCYWNFTEKIQISSFPFSSYPFQPLAPLPFNTSTKITQSILCQNSGQNISFFRSEILLKSHHKRFLFNAFQATPLIPSYSSGVYNPSAKISAENNHRSYWGESHSPSSFKIHFWNSNYGRGASFANLIIFSFYFLQNRPWTFPHFANKSLSFQMFHPCPLSSPALPRHSKSPASSRHSKPGPVPAL